MALLLSSKQLEGGKDTTPVAVFEWRNMNPILNTRIYELEFPDGLVEKYLVNTILKILLEQVDSDGSETVLISENSHFLWPKCSHSEGRWFIY